MPLDAGSLSMLTHTATWRRRTGEDQWGNNAYSAPVDLKCFVLPGTTSLGSSSSQNVERASVFQTSLICDAVGVTPGDRLDLPDGRISFVSEVTNTNDVNGSILLHEVTVTSAEGA